MDWIRVHINTKPPVIIEKRWLISKKRSSPELMRNLFSTQAAAYRAKNKNRWKIKKDPIYEQSKLLLELDKYM